MKSSFLSAYYRRVMTTTTIKKLNQQLQQVLQRDCALNVAGLRHFTRIDLIIAKRIYRKWLKAGDIEIS